MTQQTYISKIKSLHNKIVWKMHRYFNFNVLHNREFYLSILLQSFVNIFVFSCYKSIATPLKKISAQTFVNSVLPIHNPQ